MISGDVRGVSGGLGNFGGIFGDIGDILVISRDTSGLRIVSGSFKRFQRAFTGS